MQYFLYGVSGAGKSTSAFDRFIMPAFETQRPNPEERDEDGNLLPQGRDVFGNIYIDREKVEAYLGFKVRYKFINSKHLRDPANWPNIGEADDDGRPTSIDPGKLFTPGSLIVIDEARSVWRNNDTVDHRILRAIDTQRHFSTDLGYGIDIIWMGQTKKQFHKDLRDNGEAFYKLSSLAEMGKKDCHKLTIFKSWECRRDDVIYGPEEVQHNQRFYGMYASVATGQADRKVLDERIFSVKHGPKFYVYLMIAIGVGAMLIVGVGVYFMAGIGKSNTDDKAAVSNTKTTSQLSSKGGKFCDEPVLLSHGERLVVRVDGDGFSRVVPDDGTCEGGTSSTGSALAGFRGFESLASVGR